MTFLVPKTLHPVCLSMRDLRKAAGMSLQEAGRRLGIGAIVLGSYERGDRNPPLTKAEGVLNAYGYTLAAVPNHINAVRLPTDMIAELRAIADQLEARNAVSAVPREDPRLAAVRRPYHVPLPAPGR